MIILFFYILCWLIRAYPWRSNNYYLWPSPRRRPELKIKDPSGGYPPNIRIEKGN